MTEDSRAANQVRDEPIAPTPAHDGTPGTATDQPDTSAEGTHEGAREQAQAGVPERGVTDVTAAPGTSEALPPVEGVHVPDTGPGGADFDTDQSPLPGRTTDSR